MVVVVVVVVVMMGMVVVVVMMMMMMVVVVVVMMMMMMVVVVVVVMMMMSRNARCFRKQKSAVNCVYCSLTYESMNELKCIYGAYKLLQDKTSRVHSARCTQCIQ